MQPGLIDAKAFLDRAYRMGHTLGRFQQNEDRIRGTRQRSGTPKGRLKSVAALALWTLRERRARQLPEGVGVPMRARALLRIGRHRQLLAGPRPTPQEPPGAA